MKVGALLTFRIPQGPCPLLDVKNFSLSTSPRLYICIVQILSLQDTHAECAFDLDVIRNKALQYRGDFTVLTSIEYLPPSSSRFGASLTGPRHTDFDPPWH